MKCRINQIKAPFIIFISTIIALQISTASQSIAQYFSFEGNRTKNSLSFELIKNLIIVPVYINNKGPFNFVLDTGVNPMIITDPSLKDTLGLTGLRPVTISGFGDGGEIEALLSNNINVRIKNASLERMPTVIFQDDLFNLSGYLGKRVYGLIGFNFFNSFLVKINYPTKRLVFSTNTEKRKIKGEKLPIEFIENKPYVNVKITTPQNGQMEVKLIIDCGASHALSLETLNGQNFPIPDPHIYGNLGVGLSGEISGAISRVNKLEIGSSTFSNVLTSFPSFTEFTRSKVRERNGNLGAEILKRFHVTFDYKNSAVYLKKNEFFKNPFDHDMSGIEIYVSEKPHLRYFISRLETGSPAEKAGVLLNDEILSINFRPIETYTLDEINQLFKSNDGQAVIIELWRKDQVIVKLLKLKRRV